MSISRLFLPLAVATGLLLPIEAANAGGPNVAVCMTLANAYNQCIVAQRQRQPRGGGYGQGYGPQGYDRRGYGQGYDPGWGGGGSGWGDDDDEGYGYRRPQRRPPPYGPREACMSWLIQMKAANCY
jgi:hypothetical protein